MAGRTQPGQTAHPRGNRRQTGNPRQTGETGIDCPPPFAGWGKQGMGMRMRVLTLLGALVAGALALVDMGSMAAFAGQPHEWQMGFQQSATPIMDQLTWFDNMLLYIITAISLFVLALLLIVMVRFNAKANPEPSTTTHNTLIEVAWTIIPVLILVTIAIPSFRLLYNQVVVPEADVTIKATGYQWYWGYEYPDHGGMIYDALMVEDADLKEGQPRLLETDTEVVVPVNKVVRLQVTAADVIHAWTIPAFGVKIDAVPGRLNETWFKATKTGTYYGQCSELCGIRHAFMPIKVRVVTEEEFASWTEWAQQEYAGVDTNVSVASAEQSSDARR